MTSPLVSQSYAANGGPDCQWLSAGRYPSRRQSQRVCAEWRHSRGHADNRLLARRIRIDLEVEVINDEDADHR